MKRLVDQSKLAKRRRNREEGGPEWNGTPWEKSVARSFIRTFPGTMFLHSKQYEATRKLFAEVGQELPPNVALLQKIPVTK